MLYLKCECKKYFCFTSKYVFYAMVISQVQNNGPANKTAKQHTSGGGEVRTRADLRPLGI